MPAFGKPNYDVDRVEKDLTRRQLEANPQVSAESSESAPLEQEAPSSASRKPQSGYRSSGTPYDPDGKPYQGESAKGVQRATAPSRVQTRQGTPQNSDARPGKGYTSSLQETISTASGLSVRLERLIDETADFLGYGEEKRREARAMAAKNPAEMEKKLTAFVDEKVKPSRKNSALSIKEAISKNPGKIVYAQIEAKGELSYVVLDAESEEGKDNAILHGAKIEWVSASRTPFPEVRDLFPKLGEEVELSNEQTSEPEPGVGAEPVAQPSVSPAPVQPSLIDEQYGNMVEEEQEREYAPVEEEATPNSNYSNADSGVGSINYYSENGELMIYTDGACKKNPGFGGWGAHFEHEGKLIQLYGGDSDTTNNKMELEAIIRAFEQLEQLRCEEPICILTDSEYARKGLLEWRGGWERRGWKTMDGSPIKNLEQWKRLFELYDAANEKRSEKQKVNILWVKGHSDNLGNQKADELANKGTELVRNKNNLRVAWMEVEGDSPQPLPANFGPQTQNPHNAPVAERSEQVNRQANAPANPQQAPVQRPDVNTPVNRPEEGTRPRFKRG